MKILVVHNSYQQRGGEDNVVSQEVELLAKAGHEVTLEYVTNDSISGSVAKIRAFANAPYDASRGGWMANLVKTRKPDIVHVHNFFPLLTPAVHEGAAQAGAAVVQTLHNYRVVCAAALLLRDGKVCEKCLTGNRLWGVAHRCYRGSLPGSLAVARMQLRADRHRTWHRHVHRFIALTDFSRRKFISAGLPADRISVKPNFLAPYPEGPEDSRQGALFVGRLSSEKGVNMLVEAWQGISDVPLTIVGTGPEAATLRAKATANVTFVGELAPAQVHEQMRRASMLVVPSLWYEGFPMVLLEAFAAGLPVIASRIGSLADLIVPGQNGEHFATGDIADLRETVGRVSQAPQALASMGVQSKEMWRAFYSPDQNLTQLLTIYSEALSERNRDVRSG